MGKSHPATMLVALPTTRPQAFVLSKPSGTFYHSNSIQPKITATGAIGEMIRNHTITENQVVVLDWLTTFVSGWVEQTTFGDCY